MVDVVILVTLDMVLPPAVAGRISRPYEDDEQADTQVERALAALPKARRERERGRAREVWEEAKCEHLSVSKEMCWPARTCKVRNLR